MPGSHRLNRDHVQRPLRLAWRLGTLYLACRTLSLVHRGLATRRGSSAFAASSGPIALSRYAA
eukprot:CAMPEP_0183575630 /NCGR_PEP_ID=MMETSP0371-20130417/136023_1 /TAXON_ID=268820 /ORGANISM="Peridinium aciculiferum, Strain PAER-2" /LENGTH=62 /DNA_ID=CAMNT_0025785809 /DNA_START=57 /DNA_END=241 /DNA_ORIENTATION=+